MARCKSLLKSGSVCCVTKEDDLQMLKTLVMGAVTALVVTTSTAMADGMPTRAPMTAAVPSWTGFYIGVGVGGAFVTHENSATRIEDRKDWYGDPVVDIFRLWDLENGRSHAFGTVTAGYDHLFGHWVAGVFVDYDFGKGWNDSRLLDNGFRLSQEDKHALSIGGRLGFLSNPSTLLYLSTGWTRVSFDNDFWVNDTRFSFNRDRDGWFVGAGIETQLGWIRSGLSLRGEYRFTRLSDDHSKITLGEGYECDYSCTVAERIELNRDTEVHSVRAVLAYKFGRPEAVAPLK
jgi:outer membrane immunogenic protein